MTEHYEGGLFDYMQYVHRCGLEGIRVHFGTEKNTPKKRTAMRWHIYCRDGAIYSLGGWNQFIESIYELGQKQVDLNFNKIEEWIRQHRTNDIERFVSVEFVPKEGTPRYDVVDLEFITKQSKKLKADKFRIWVREYLEAFPNVDIEVDDYISVKKVIELCEQVVEKDDEGV